MNEDGRPRRVLIILLGAIGDVVRALPLAVRIKRAWPDTMLDWAVEPISEPMVRRHPAIDRVIVFDRPGGLAAYTRFARELRAGAYDLVIDAQRHLKSGFTSLITGASRRIGFHRRNSREGNWLFNNDHIAPAEHFSLKIEQFQQFGDALGLAPLEPLEFGLAALPEETAKVEELIAAGLRSNSFDRFPPGRRAAFIMGSTWPSRFWKPQYFAQISKELYEKRGLCSLLIGGWREREISAAVLTLLPGVPAVSLVEKTGLRDLIAVFSSSAVAVGSDSGPMHIAAAVRTPVISLWGSTSPLRSAPYGSEHMVLQSKIGCSPCYRRTCPGLDTLCMAEITPQNVMERIEQYLP